MTDGSPFISFYRFWSECWIPLNGIDLPIKPCHKLICGTLQDAFFGQLFASSGKRAQFIVITEPPRTGKTKLLEALPLWAWSYFPDSQWIYTAYADDVAKMSTDYIRSVMVSEWYQQLFSARIGHFRQRDHISTSAGGNLFAEGVGGQLLGKGGGLKHPAGGMILADDLAKPDEILSAVVADGINFWIENGLKSRRNSSEWCPIVLCAQRLGTNDPPGYVLEHYPEVTVHIKVPQIAADGTNNFPETRTLEDCARTKAANPFAYSAQLQQEPIILGGNLIHTADFVMEEIGAAIRWDSKIITADTALEAGQENDNSVLHCWGRLGTHAYLIDEVAGKWESPELLAMALAFYRKHHQPSDNADRVNSPVNRFTVEKKASGHGLIQQLQRLGIPAEGIERTKDKVTRVQEILPYIATHMVHVARNAPWTSAFLSECAAFRADGKAPHDDRVDTLCDGVWILLGKPISILDSMLIPRKRFG